MTDRTVSLAIPWGGHRLAVLGQAEDDSVIGVIARNNGYYEQHVAKLLARAGYVDCSVRSDRSRRSASNASKRHGRSRTRPGVVAYNRWRLPTKNFVVEPR